jgi:hypothetical protein
MHTVANWRKVGENNDNNRIMTKNILVNMDNQHKKDKKWRKIPKISIVAKDGRRRALTCLQQSIF